MSTVASRSLPTKQIEPQPDLLTVDLQKHRNIEVPASGRLAIVGKLLFAPVRYEQSQAVLTLEVPTWKSNVLISTRRQPSESPLDGPAFGLFQLESTGAGEIAVYARTKGAPREVFRLVGYTWSPATGKWRQIDDSEVRSRSGDPTRFYPGFTHAHKVAERGALPTPNSRLTMQLSKGAKEGDEVPVTFDAGSGSGSLPKGRSAFGEIRNMYGGLWLGCDAGIVFPHNTSGPGFWFLPRREFEAYLASRKLPLPEADRSRP